MLNEESVSIDTIQTTCAILSPSATPPRSTIAARHHRPHPPSTAPASVRFVKRHDTHASRPSSRGPRWTWRSCSPQLSAQADAAPQR
jgi:hypothetical protein